MPLPSGSRLGPYEIVAPIGAGGMGEVYKARDTRLERAVAVKILSEAVAGDADLRVRFEREARAIAALDHPHICAIYDVGQQDGLHYLVMQHLDGETLAARLERVRGALPLDQALPIAIAIADALDKTHRAGIVHRDLKPANIMLTRSGAKLLDFGLAKLRGQAAAISMSGMTRLPAAGPNTARGTILGTVQYMAPEQVEGREADARSDVWALGALLYEMTTGRRPFDGETPASVIGAILKDTPPPISARQPLAPQSLDRLVRTCLEKDPDERWQSVGDVGRELRWIASNPSTPGVTAGTPRRWTSYGGWAVAAALLLGVIAAFVGRRATPPGELMRLSVVPPDKAFFSGGVNATVPVPQFAVSPDGTQIVFAAATTGTQPSLWLRSLQDLEARPLPQTEGTENPFWSPDGRWIGFFADGKLKKVPATGGPPQLVAEGVPNALGGSWGADGTILFAAGSTPIFRVPSTGGAVQPVTVLDTTHRETSHRWPQFLPDGDHFLYLSRAAEVRGIYVATLDGKTKKRLVDVDSSGLYVRPGYLLWLDGDTLLGQPFDATRLELTGQSLTVAQRVGHSSTGYAAASASQMGLLAYAAPILRSGRLTWFERTGEAGPSIGPEGDYSDFRLSPDGKRLAVTLIDPKIGGADIWIDDLARGRSRLTNGPALNAAPTWSPDGSRIVFRSNRIGTLELFQKSAAGGGAETSVYSFRQQTTLGMQTNNLVPSDWSPDGRQVIFSTPTISSGSNDLFLLPMDGGQPVSLVSSPSDQIHGAFSPDGHLLAYDSNESGRFEVYVETFPRSERKWQVSTSGGSEPRWRGDGREIYYLSEDRKLMAVAVGSGPAFAVPKMLFQTRTSGMVTPFRTSYVANRAGDRFLINTQTDDSAHIPITVVLNWATLLNK